MSRLHCDVARASLVRAFLFAALMSGMARTALAAEAAAPSLAELEAPQLVQAALDAAATGDAARRSALLEKALAVDPNCGPARWQSGQLQFQGKWRTADEVADLVAHNASWKQYCELRQELGESPAAHLQLAEWCRDHRLPDEERYHWANVLLAQPDHATARERLQLHEYRGGLFTQRQIDELEAAARLEKKNLAAFKPRFTALCRDACTNDEPRRAAALSQLRAASDPAAIAALESAVERASENSSKFSTDLQLAMVAALGNMPQYEATLRLLNHAVFSPQGDVRQAAAEALKLRPQTDYLPLLMAALTSPVEVDVDVFAAPDGTVRMTETLYQKGAEADAAHVHSTNFETEGVLRYDRAKNNPGRVLSSHLARAAARAADTEQRVADANAAAEERNERIEAVLKATAAIEPATSVESWWTEWQQYNELQYGSETPVSESYSEENFRFVYEQAPVMVPVAEGQRPITHSSCFAAGTPVWTKAGLKPIEAMAVGDMVLSQNPETGEVAYRAVLRTTLGRPTRVLRLEFRGEAIVATRGHRFWVNGSGWKMAKFLEPGASLHSLKGPIDVQAIAPDADIECYNLVVDEFHTYFVGKSRLLVHDIGCPRPVVAGVPGSATPRRAADVGALARLSRKSE
jgi:hypothetical protein